MRFHPGSIALAALALSFLWPIAAQSAHSNAASAPAPAQVAAPAYADRHSYDGQQLFQQHCARCHNAPESFSPRIAGTVVRHMRMRASLSRKEEEALLRFFNP